MSSLFINTFIYFNPYNLVGIFQENRYLTDLRTGAAGAVSVKYFCHPKKHLNVAFIGAGMIAKAMADSTHVIHRFKQGYAYGLDDKITNQFCKDIEHDLGYPVKNCATAEEAIRNADVIFTQTPAAKTVLELGWLRPHATIIASGSDQPTKNEIPSDVMKKSKFVADLVRQCSRVGELRTAIKEGVMKEEDVYCEIGDVVNGSKPGRVGDELILGELCELTTFVIV
jgi:ornithine cyclodeaminase/alanine dehydrogenase-like protein (mu-crystallin family)